MNRRKYKPRKSPHVFTLGAETIGPDMPAIYAARPGAETALFVGTLERRNWRWYPGGYATSRAAMFALMEAR